VLLSAAAAVDPIWDAATLETIGEARLDATAGYLSIAPISSVFDTLTLLTVGQHIALVLWIILGFVAYRVWRARDATFRVGREVIGAGGLLAIIIVVYAAAAIMPRPMAQLVTSDATIIALDLNFNGADKIAERLRRSMPPGLADDGADKKPAEVLAQQNQQQPGNHPPAHGYGPAFRSVSSACTCSTWPSSGSSAVMVLRSDTISAVSFAISAGSGEAGRLASRCRA